MFDGAQGDTVHLLIWIKDELLAQFYTAGQEVMPCCCNVLCSHAAAVPSVSCCNHELEYVYASLEWLCMYQVDYISGCARCNSEYYHDGLGWRRAGHLLYCCIFIMIITTTASIILVSLKELEREVENRTDRLARLKISFLRCQTVTLGVMRLRS